MKVWEHGSNSLCIWASCGRTLLNVAQKLYHIFQRQERHLEINIFFTDVCSKFQLSDSRARMRWRAVTRYNNESCVCQSTATEPKKDTSIKPLNTADRSTSFTPFEQNHNGRVAYRRARRLTSNTTVNQVSRLPSPNHNRAHSRTCSGERVFT